MILERQLDILVFLYNSNDWITSHELSRRFNLNKKTIQSDIKMLTHFFSEGLIIRTSQSKGYFIEYISENVKKMIIIELNEKIRENSLLPQHSSIVLYLLFLKNPITMQDLADKFFMSKAAINLELETIKRWMERYEGIDLEISRKSGVIVHANEKVKRLYCAKNGSVYAFKNIPFPNDLMKEYERYFFSVKKILSNCCINYRYIITGEELEKNTRFITISIIRSLMGYKKQTMAVKEIIDPLTRRLALQIKNELGYKLEADELSDIQILLDESDIIKLDFKSDSKMLEKTKHFVKKALASVHVSNEYVENVDCTLLTQHMEKVLSRNNSGEVAINHYNEKILLRYPLEIHLSYLFLEQIFSVKLNKESSFIALFLATYFREYKNRTRMLLVIDQNISIGQSIKSLFEEYESFHINQFTILPTYYYQNNETVKESFDLLLTTNSEIVLNDSSFYLVSTIITTSEINSIYFSIRKKIQQSHKNKMDIIREHCLKEKTITTKDEEYDEILDMVEKNRTCTYHTFSKYNLFICKASNKGDNKIIVYHLNFPLFFKHKKIKRIVLVEYVRSNPDIFPFFSTVSEVLYSYS
ncbi:HTH domain-containing protein [Erwinia sp. CPCC 100877]|nr:HTH domain-containing protein [Erwinia sp. CPCC 100877]